MVSAPLAQPPEAETSPGKISWAAVAWFSGLLILCYAPILYRMGYQWATDEDMGHGFFVPLVAGYIAWQRRKTLLAIPRKTNNWGLVLVILAAFQSLAATLGAELFTARLAFVVALFGVILYIGGKAWVKALLFPLLLLLFMIPIPQIIYARLTLGLQMLASQLGETLIGWMGIPVIRTGNVLELPSQSLDVVEACSGIRSLMSLTFLSLIYAYFTDKRIWMRWVLLIATIPIAILANGARVAITGLMSEINTDLAKGAYHEMEGYIVFIVALGSLIVLHRVLNVIGKRWKRA
ncbi:MAG TPA: exosortase/archaeosortase family protein [Bryobacteraceae bacterium]|nr:exosortase/archaeosortase family protein [Bryobacteraceae bacterium]